MTESSSKRRRLKVAALVATALGLAVAFTQCRGTQALDRKTGPKYESEVQSWLLAVDELAEDGMWLVARGYHAGDDVIAVATNAPLSHAVVLDKTRGEVVEAIGKGVVVTPLEKFVRESHRLRIIRPDAWTPKKGVEAAQRARSKIGAGYDYLGIVGVPSDEHFYCSELAAWSIGIKVDRKGPQHVLHPKDMDELGQVLFDSGGRDSQPDYPR